MAIESIQLYPDDDINSMRDRLDWAKSERVVFILPEGEKLLTQETDLALLARHADGLRIHLGLITQDPATRQKAMALGFPTFLTLDLAETQGREWRRPRAAFPDCVQLVQQVWHANQEDAYSSST